MARRKISSTLEDYLEAILRLVRTKAAARARDIADALGVHRSTVTAALKSLSEQGYIHYAPYEVVTLTDQGVRAAEDVLRRHEGLRKFFIDVLGVTPKVAEEAACAMEHAAPAELITRMRAFRLFMEACPRVDESWRRRLYTDCPEAGGCDACVGECRERLREPKPEDEWMTVGLDQLEAGGKGRVVSMRCGGELRKRLAEMGVTPGTTIEVERVAPLGDPLEVRVRGYSLSIRKQEAAGITVAVEGEAVP